MTPDEVFLFFAYEPCDEVTRVKLERVLRQNCPGDYHVEIMPDRSGFEIVFDTAEAETMWRLRWS